MGKMRRWLCCYHQVDEPYHVSENEYRKSPTNNTDGMLFAPPFKDHYCFS